MMVSHHYFYILYSLWFAAILQLNLIQPKYLQSFQGLKPVSLNPGQFCPPGDIWQRLETFLVVTTVRALLTPTGSGWRCC